MSGLDDDGKPKFRAVDDFSKSEINACTAAAEKLKRDTLDMFHNTLREMHMRLKVRKVGSPNVEICSGYLVFVFIRYHCTCSKPT